MRLAFEFPRQQRQGFDMQTPNVANEIVRDFVAKADQQYSSTLAQASGLALASSRAQQHTFGTAVGTLPIELAAGKTIRFGGYIRTEGVSGYAGFWWRADNRNQPAAFANLGTTAPKGTTEWKYYELELPIRPTPRASISDHCSPAPARPGLTT